MNFIFFSIDNEFYNTLYSDFAKLPNHLISLSSLKRSKIENAMIGWKLPLPWIRAELFKNCFKIPMQLSEFFSVVNSDETECFIIYGRILQLYGPCLVTYLKRIRPKAKLVCYLGDVVSTFTFDIENVKKNFDLVFSCDRKDASLNGLLFLQEPYSLVKNELVPLEYDFLFIGNEKGRLNKIHKIFETLTSRGYKCKFYINEVEEKRQIFPHEIVYNKYLPYSEVINLIKKSRCIIEILQVDADTTTTRFSEALLYKKYLLTDSEYLSKSDNIAPNIIYLDYKDWSVLEKIYVPLKYDDKKYKDELSIDTMVAEIYRKIISLNKT